MNQLKGHDLNHIYSSSLETYAMDDIKNWKKQKSNFRYFMCLDGCYNNNSCHISLIIMLSHLDYTCKLTSKAYQKSLS